MVSVGASVLGGRSLEGSASAAGGSSAPSGVHRQGPPEEPGLQGKTVYALGKDGHNVYCSSVSCVSALLAQGFRLSDAGQLATLVRELAANRAISTHDPSDHFK